MAVLSDKFKNKIEELIHYTKSRIDEMQVNCCPMTRDLYLHHQFEYWYDGYKHYIYTENTQCYAVNELPYCYPRYKEGIFQDKLENLINEEKIWPFLLFIEGKVIPWSKITVIKDYNYTYIIINDVEPINDQPTSTSYVYFPISPTKIRYGEDEDYLQETNVKGMYFDTEGKLLMNPEFKELSLRLEFLDDNLYFKMHKYSIDDEYVTFDELEDGFVPTESNIIGFDEDGTFADIIGYPIFGDNILNSMYGMIPLDKGREKFQNPTLVQMYFKNDNVSKSSIYHRASDLNKESIIDTMGKFASDERFEGLMREIAAPFDFKFYANHTYLKNIVDAAKYITQYDYSLWNKIYIDESNIKIFTYKGRDFKNLADEKSFVRFSRKHSDLIEDVCMMFVNSKLYEHSIDIYYRHGTIHIPAFGIMDDDDVEIVLFTKCNNNILDVVIPDAATPVYIHPEYNLEDCYIMDSECTQKAYPNTPESEDGRRQYICQIRTYSVDKDSNYTVNFVYPEYYGKRLKIVPKNQFRYYRYQNMEGQHKIILPRQFNYCHDIDRYMIFVNGRKIDKREYTVTIMNPLRPFDSLILYISTVLDENDKVDVFYLPELLPEKYSKDNLDVNGVLRLSIGKDPTNYPKMYSLSKDTCMVFVNGYLINPMRIKDVSMRRMLVDTGLNNIHNVQVIEYINGSKEVAKYLYGMDGALPINGIADDGTSYDVNGMPEYVTGEDNLPLMLGVQDEDFSKFVYDRWDYVISKLEEMAGSISGEIVDINGNSVDNMSDENIGIAMVYGTLNSILNPESDYKEDYAPLRAILYDIIVDYYLTRNAAPTGDPFVYDFEVEEWTEDNEGNELITLFPD
ncbi:MAG: hypothetical protein IKA36_00805, partial [Clostridia bacterium]|nr:hypothetical protein [Clostridia bacterium]